MKAISTLSKVSDRQTPSPNGIQMLTAKARRLLNSLPKISLAAIRYCLLNFRDVVFPKSLPSSLRSEQTVFGDFQKTGTTADEESAHAEETAGSIALVGAGPGARDLLTLRAVQRLQEADVVFYDRLAGEEALALTHRNASHVYVGKQPGLHKWPQEKITARIIAEAKRGKRVVRLKSGDPGIFGRAGEELSAARAEGIEVEIVPGVTAASAAAAAQGESLTERGKTNKIVLATGTSKDGTFSDAALACAAPGTSAAIYMGIRQAAAIRAGLLERGVPGNTIVTITVDVSKPSQRIITTQLAELPESLRAYGITGDAIIMFRWETAEELRPMMAAE